MSHQSTDRILMIRPVTFRMNEETAATNLFQRALETPELTSRAQAEFDGMVEALEREGVDVMVFEDTPTPDTPDALFPNNWVSFHDDGRVVFYPMCAPNRRQERREDIPEALASRYRFRLGARIDLTASEASGAFLEGTGSMVLDRQHGVAYAALGPRTDSAVLAEFCRQFGYEPVTFEALMGDGTQRQPIYHTNVMMAIGTSWAVICLESIATDASRSAVEQRLRETGREVVALTKPQVLRFAGNMLEVRGRDGATLIVMSRRAHDALREGQLQRLRAHGRLIIIDLDVIEVCGGGSVRCMMAEVHLPFEGVR